MSYNRITIERDRNGFKVRATDPAIEKKNRERSKDDGPCGPWVDPEVSFSFDTKEAVTKFIDKAIDIALPADEFSSAFDRIAKEAQGKE